MADPVLITLAQANDHLRLDLGLTDTSPPAFEDERIPHLLVLMVAAESVICDYLKIDGAALSASPPVFSDQDIEVIRAAALLALAALWDDAPERTIGDYLKRDGTIALMLARLRDPALA